MEHGWASLMANARIQPNGSVMLDPLSYYVIRKCRVTIGLLPNLSLTAIKLSV